MENLRHISHNTGGTPKFATQGPIKGLPREITASKSDVRLRIASPNTGYDYTKGLPR